MSVTKESVEASIKKLYWGYVITVDGNDYAKESPSAVKEALIMRLEGMIKLIHSTAIDSLKINISVETQSKY